MRLFALTVLSSIVSIRSSFVVKHNHRIIQKPYRKCHFNTTSRAKLCNPPFFVKNNIIDTSNNKNALVASFSAQDIIEASVSFDTFAPQFLWLSMIAAPNSSITKKVMGPIGPVLGLSVVHLIIVILAAVQKGAIDQILIFTEVFDPSLSQLAGMQKLFQFPNFVAEEWPHVLVWDLFVGRAIWLDGIHRGIDTRFALSFCNLIGPPGLLIHAAVCSITGKGLPSFGYPADNEDAN